VASKIVSLILQAKNMLSPSVDDATKSLGKAKDRALELEKSLAKFEGAQAAIDSLDDVRDAASEAEKAFDEAQLEVIRLKAELKTEKTPELALALDKAKISSSAAKKEWAATTKTVTSLEKKLERAGVDINDMAGSQTKLTASLNNTKGAMTANNQRLESLRKKTGEYSTATEKSTASMGGFITKAAGFLGVYTLINKVQNAFSGLGNSVYDSGIQFEKLGARLSDLELGYIEEFARDVPFQLAETAEAFAQLKTFGIDPMNGSLQAISDQTAKLGGGQEELKGIVTALGQAWGKQKLQQEEVLQLIERGVPAWDLLSKATGKTTQELQKMSTAGQLGRREISLLIEAMGQESSGAAAKQMETLAGLVSNLQDRFTQFSRMIADAGVFDYLKQQATDLIAKFEELGNNGQLEKMAKQIADTFIQGAEAVKSFASTIYELSGTMVTLGQAWLGLKIVTWAGQLKAAAVGFVSVDSSAKGASFSLRSLATAAKAAMGAFVVQQIFNVVSAYKELGIEINKLEAAQRKQVDVQNIVEARLRGISESTGIAVQSMSELEAQVRAGNIVIDEQSNQYLSAAQAAELFASRQVAVADSVKGSVLNQDLLTQSMRNTSEALKDATTDNSKLASVLNDQLLQALNGGVEGVGGFVLALQSAQQSGDLTAKQIDDGLVSALDKLSDEERLRFGQQIREAMAVAAQGTENAGVKIEYLQRLMDQFDESNITASLKRLGIEQAELTNGISSGVEQSLKDLDALSNSLSNVGNSTDSNEAVFDGLSNAIAGIKTEADGLALSDSIDQFRNKGQITYAQYAQLKDKIIEVGNAGIVAGAGMASGIEQAGKGAAKASENVALLSDAAEKSERDVRGAASSLAEFFNNVKNDVYALSDAAGAAFSNKMGIEVQPVLDEIESLRAGIDAAHVEISALGRDNLTLFDATGIARFSGSVLKAQDEVEIAYNSQKIKFLEYLDAIESGEGVNQSFINSAENSIGNMKLLGQEDLSQLRNALDSANQKLEQMSDSAASTLSSLQDELDSLQGNQEAIDQRDYEAKRAELNAAIEDAKLYGNKEAIASYTESLNILEQVRREQSSQAAAAAKEAKNSSSSSSSGSSSSSTNSNSTTINLQSPTGNKSVTLNGDQQSVANLLAVLEDAGLRSQ
jgi:tape measure domain-containing protein